MSYVLIQKKRSIRMIIKHELKILIYFAEFNLFLCVCNKYFIHQYQSPHIHLVTTIYVTAKDPI